MAKSAVPPERVSKNDLDGVIGFQGAGQLSASPITGHLVKTRREINEWQSQSTWYCGLPVAEA